MARKRPAASQSANATGTLVADLEAATSTPCPFIIVIDSREQNPFSFRGIPSIDKDDGLPLSGEDDDPDRWIPYSFDGIESNAETDRLPFAVETVVHGLDVGDYSLAVPDSEDPNPPSIRIERKSKGDLFASVAKRENFEWRLERMNDETESAHIVVEAEWSEIMTQPPRYTDYNPTSVHRTIQSWSHRYSKVHWWFYPGREAARTATFWFLYHFWRNNHYHKADRDRRAANHKAYLKGMMAFRNRVKITECPIPRLHAIGDAADHWAKGWLDMEALNKGKIRAD